MRKYSHLLVNVAKLEPGAAYIASKGDDFNCEPESFRGVVYQLAQKKGYGWHGTSCVIGRSVVYAFYKGTDYMKPNLSAYPIVKKLRGEA